MSRKFDVKKEVRSNLTFKPQEKFNNLCIGVLKEVSVDYNEAPKVKENGEVSTYEYAGHKLPTLVFRFKQVLTGGVDRYYNHRERIIPSSFNGEKIEQSQLDDKYDTMWARIKHIIDAYQGSPNFVELKSVPEIRDDGTVEERVEDFSKFFDTIVKFFNSGSDKKPIFEDAKGEPYKMVMKLLADYTSRKYLCFPKYVGKGFIERAVITKDDGLVTTLEVGPSESIELGGKRSGKVSDSSMPDGQGDELSDELKSSLGIG